MKKVFVYTVYFGEEYLFDVVGIEDAIKLAKQLKKNLKSLGRNGFYNIYYDSVLIAQF